MIIRAWLLVGGALIVTAWVLTVAYSPHPFQGSETSAIEDYRARGLVPDPGQLVMSEAVGHDVFEVPETDALHAREAAAAMGSMPGMNMSEPSEHAAGAGDASKEPAHGEQPMAPMQMEGSGGHDGGAQTATGAGSMAGHGTQAEAPKMTMPGMEMTESGQAGGHGGGGGLVQLASGTPMAAAARTVRIEMSEWGFSPASLDVKHGESVRLVVHNTGNMPHEFMLMTPAGMGAVDYRLQRADWNLLEHEAIYERELVLPGDEIEVVLRIAQPGTWMYMCMFPYHMQFGMMGVMATEGMAMDMGGMKM